VAVWVGFVRLGQTIGPLAAAASVASFGFGPTYGAGVVLAMMLAVTTAVFGSRFRPRQQPG